MLFNMKKKKQSQANKSKSECPIGNRILFSIQLESETKQNNKKGQNITNKMEIHEVKNERKKCAHTKISTIHMQQGSHIIEEK